MSARGMLTQTLRLDCQPGGVMPELHLKKNARSMALTLIIPPGTALTDAFRKRCVLKATLPDGTEVFEPGFTQNIRREVVAEFSWVAVASVCPKATSSIATKEAMESQITSLIMAGATVIGYVIGEGLADSGHSGEDTPSENEDV